MFKCLFVKKFETFYLFLMLAEKVAIKTLLGEFSVSSSEAGFAQ
jgi:hypothetical protein